MTNDDKLEFLNQIDSRFEWGIFVTRQDGQRVYECKAAVPVVASERGQTSFTAPSATTAIDSAFRHYVSGDSHTATMREIKAIAHRAEEDNMHTMDECIALAKQTGLPINSIVSVFYLYREKVFQD